MWTKWARLYQVVHFTCLILTISKGTSGQTCSFMETSGQKGVDSLRSNTGNTTTDVDGCKTLCNTTDLCIAGEFLSSTNTCYMYSLETTLTAQADTVFFQWDCTNETDRDLNQKGKIASAVSACAFFGVCVVLLMIIIFFRKGRKRDDEKQNWTTYTGRT
ncbi:uncharacterized protein [Haliotis asinina]|uniref:uncharacterized protein isoform X5 n=1 Tax=Haliotis asinina TaxID=109174 RepID=UPI0035328018